MLTYLIQLRNADRALIHAGTRRAESCSAAMTEYLASLPAPFNHYDIRTANSLQDEHNYQYTVNMGPFRCIVIVEHMTAASEPQDDAAEPAARSADTGDDSSH